MMPGVAGKAGGRRFLRARPVLLRALAVALVAGTAVACGGPAQPARGELAELEIRKRALQLKLAELQRLSDQDGKLREGKRRTLEVAELLDRTDLAGQGAFLAVHRTFLTELVRTLLPLRREVDGFHLTFQACELTLLPSGIQARLRYQARSPALQGLADDAVEGTLQARFDFLRQPGSGQLDLRFTPLDLSVDERFYRAARVVEQRLRAEQLAGLLPDLPLPLTLPDGFTWQGQELSTGIQFDPGHLLVLPERVLIPFTVHPGKIERSGGGRPATFTVLLQDHEGRTGEVTLANAWGSRAVRQAGDAVGFDAGEAPGEPFHLSPEELRQIFGAALDAAPPPPVSHILYFQSDSSELTAESRQQLAQVIKELEARPAPDLSITGHTDAVGDDAYNVALAQQRAETVRTILLQAIPGAKIVECTSHGSRNPLVPTAVGVEEPRNRRVEVLVR